MSVNHYENFPVGSIVLPRRLRKPVHAVYALHGRRTILPTKAMPKQPNACANWTS